MTLKKIAEKILNIIDPALWETLAHDNEIKNLTYYTNQFQISEPVQMPTPPSFYEFNSRVLHRQFELKCSNPHMFRQQYLHGHDRLMQEIRRYIIRDICQLKHCEPEKYNSDYKWWFFSKKSLLKRLNEIKQEDLDKYHHLFMQASLNGIPLLKRIQASISTFLVRLILDNNN